MKVYEFISEANWTQKALCRDASGNEWRWPYASEITQWDLVGMVLFLYGRLGDSRQDEIFARLTGKIGGSIHRWNDAVGRTWEEVRDLCKELDI